MGSLPIELITSSGYFSPACSTEPFLPSDKVALFPSTLLFVGGEEDLLPSITTLRTRLVDAHGLKVEYLLSEGSCHDFLAAEGIPNLLWGRTAGWRREERVVDCGFGCDRRIVCFGE